MTKTELKNKINKILIGRVQDNIISDISEQIASIFPSGFYKEKALPNPDVKVVIDKFKELHLRYIGTKVDINYGKDGKRVKELLQTKTKDEIIKVIQWALSTETLKRESTTIPFILNSFVFTSYYKWRKDNGYKD